MQTCIQVGTQWDRLLGRNLVILLSRLLLIVSDGLPGHT